MKICDGCLIGEGLECTESGCSGCSKKCGLQKVSQHMCKYKALLKAKGLSEYDEGIMQDKWDSMQDITAIAKTITHKRPPYPPTDLDWMREYDKQDV